MKSRDKLLGLHIENEFVKIRSPTKVSGFRESPVVRLLKFIFGSIEEVWHTVLPPVHETKMSQSSFSPSPKAKCEKGEENVDFLLPFFDIISLLFSIVTSFWHVTDPYFGALHLTALSS